MQERKRMPLKAAVPIALEVWNKLTEQREKDAIESVIFQCVRQIQQQERQKASGRNRKYYENHRTEILEKQKKRRMFGTENNSAEV